MKLSVVTTLYKSKNNIEEFINRLSKVLDQLNVLYEVIFVDDGSPDESSEIVKKLSHKLNNVSLYRLTRNFGHHEAALEGLLRAQGDYVVIMDCDLEEMPEWIPDMWKEIQINENVDMVYCVNDTRRGSYLSRVGGWVFYRMFNFLAEVTITPNLMTARIMSRRYIESLKEFKEKVIFLAGIYELVGFNKKYIVRQKLQRNQTTYSHWRRYSLLVKSISSFSSLPLQMIFYVGIGITSISFLAAIFLIYNWAMSKSYAPGWASVVVSIWLVGGIIISFIGIISIYFSTIFQEVKDRPRTLIKSVETWSKKNVSSN
jgi:putative glycosyltransferase